MFDLQPRGASSYKLLCAPKKSDPLPTVDAQTVSSRQEAFPFPVNHPRVQEILATRPRLVGFSRRTLLIFLGFFLVDLCLQNDFCIGPRGLPAAAAKNITSAAAKKKKQKLCQNNSRIFLTHPLQSVF